MALSVMSNIDQYSELAPDCAVTGRSLHPLGGCMRI